LTRFTRLTSALIAPVIFLALMTACGSPGPDRETAGGEGVIEISTLWASGNAHDLATLVATSDAVFVGEVTARAGQRLEPPSSGLPSGGRKPAELPISVFEVRVERAIAGAPAQGSTVVVEQPGGTLVQADGSELRILFEQDEALRVGARYLFFSSWKGNGALNAPPFARLEAVPGGALAPLAAWQNLGALSALAGLSVDEALGEVRGVSQ